MNVTAYADILPDKNRHRMYIIILKISILSM